MQWQAWVMTMGGVGRIPHAPGTYASFLTTLLIGAGYWVWVLAGGAPSTVMWNTALVGVLLLFCVLSVVTGPWVEAHFAKKDPGPFVLDEAAGVCLTFLFLPIEPTTKSVLTACAVFLAFRLFDILKPPPCKVLEKLPAGWGILADDLMAAVYANLACQIILRAVFY